MQTVGWLWLNCSWLKNISFLSMLFYRTEIQGQSLSFPVHSQKPKPEASQPFCLLLPYEFVCTCSYAYKVCPKPRVPSKSFKKIMLQTRINQGTMTRGYHCLTKNVSTVTNPAWFDINYWWIIARQRVKKHMPVFPCLKINASGNIVFLPAYFHFKRRNNQGKHGKKNKLQAAAWGKESFINVLLPLPFSLPDSSPVPCCAKTLTHRACSRWISTVAHRP